MPGEEIVLLRAILARLEAIGEGLDRLREAVEEQTVIISEPPPEDEPRKPWE